MADEQITIVETTETIVITETPTQVVEVIQPVTQIVEVVSQGPQGPAGPNTIGGYGFSIDGEIDGDVLGFNGASWYNRRQETLSDGGNF